MQQSFTLKADLACALEDAAATVGLKAPQLHGYALAVGLLTVDVFKLTPHVQELVENMVRRFEFLHPELRDRTPNQEDLPF